MHVPDAIVDLLEPDVLLDEDVRAANPALAEANATVAADVVDAEVAFEVGRPNVVWGYDRGGRTTGIAERLAARAGADEPAALEYLCVRSVPAPRLTSYAADKLPGVRNSVRADPSVGTLRTLR